MTRHDTVWQQAAIAERFLGVRAAIPYALDHARILRDLLRTGRSIERFLDVGCGGGFFTEAVRADWPEAEAVMIDFSGPMLREAQAHVASPKQIYERDLADPAWAAGVGRMDAVVSGFAIHHLPDPTKRDIYRQTHRLLNPGGWFVNIEHVASASPLGTELFDRHIVDVRHEHLARENPAITREQVEQQYDDHCDEQADILVPVEDQCDWLRELGFADVDCYFKCYGIAIFGGRRRDDPV